MKRVLSLLSLGGALAASCLHAITPIVEEAYWTGRSEDGNTWNLADNWEDDTPPSSDGTTDVFFGDPFHPEPDHLDIALNVPVNVASLNFEGGYYFELRPDYVDQSFAQITVTGAIEVNSGYFILTKPTVSSFVYGPYYEDYFTEVFFNEDVNITPQGDQVWWVDHEAELEIEGTITSSDSITLDGGGYLTLIGDNSTTFDGTVVVEDGILGIGNDNALGTGLLVLGPMDNLEGLYPGLMAVDMDQHINNDVVVNGYLYTEEDFDGEYELGIAGEVTFTEDTLIENYGGLLSFDGILSESTPGVKLTVDADEPVLIGGVNNLTGGLEAEWGATIFIGADAIPLTGDFTSSEYGYIGLIESSVADVATTMADFLARFDPANTFGAIGFDTDPTQLSPNSYPGPIDLTGFNTDVTIGSNTFAEITGTITPAGDNYRFGNGGGVLLVGSTLVDLGITPTGVDVFSDYDTPLTVYLNSSANSFTGRVTVDNSALVFGHAPGTLPSAATLEVKSGGYIGLQDTTVTIADYLGQYDPMINDGIVGFDSIDQDTLRTITDPIDLSGFTASDPSFYLGTSTLVQLDGTITLPTNTDVYRFAGYNGGLLIVNSDLVDGTNPRAVVIGDYDVAPTGEHESFVFHGDSGVGLLGNNTYSGGTELQAGQAAFTADNAFGTGTISVTGGGFFGSTTLTDPYYNYFDYLGEVFEEDGVPTLAPKVDALNTPNAIAMAGHLKVEVEEDNYQLSGDISGYGILQKSGGGALTISGDNSSFNGTTYVREGAVVFGSDNAAGTGPVGFGVTNNQIAVFTSLNPGAGGLFDNFDDFHGPTSQVLLGTGTTLTLTPDGGRYEYSGTIAGDGSLVISGSDGIQILNGDNYYTGGTTVTNGAVLGVSSELALGAASGGGTPDLELDNGTLFVADETHVTANVTFGIGGGSVAGNGVLSFDSPLAFGANSRIEPGASVGHLMLDGPIELASAGTLVIEIGDGEDGTVISDVLFAESAAFTASTLDPFTLFLTNEDGELSTNFDPFSDYAWLILGTIDSMTTFDLDLIEIEVDTNLASTTAGGAFSLFLTDDEVGIFGDGPNTDNLLVLQFTPVPEPSTYALIGLGLGLIGWQASRRRRSV